eukprot:1911481-Prymnesium_polylepis.1
MLPLMHLLPLSLLLAWQPRWQPRAKEAEQWQPRAKEAEQAATLTGVVQPLVTGAAAAIAGTASIARATGQFDVNGTESDLAVAGRAVGA